MHHQQHCSLTLTLSLSPSLLPFLSEVIVVCAPHHSGILAKLVLLFLLPGIEKNQQQQQQQQQHKKILLNATVSLAMFIFIKCKYSLSKKSLPGRKKM